MRRERKIARSINEDTNRIIARFLMVVFAVIVVVAILTFMKLFATLISQAVILLCAGAPGAIFAIVTISRKHEQDDIKMRNALCTMMCIQMIAVALVAFSYAWSIAFLPPIILATLYPKSKTFSVVTWVMILSSAVIPPLALALGFWDAEYYAFLYCLSNGMGDYSSYLADGSISLIEQMGLAARYISMQNVLFTGAFSIMGQYVHRQIDKSYENQVRIARMSETDELTGLLNRNCYERRIEEPISTEDKTICFYFDVNGLHELNNTKGHQAGDEMLQYVGEEIQRVFGEDDAYRVGGDEYVAFAADMTEGSLAEMKTSLEEVFAAHGYHVAIGYARQDTVANLGELVQLAEKEMFRAKGAYYSAHDRRRAPR